MEITHDLVGFDYMDATAADEINRNLSALYATPAGTCAGDRNYGLKQDFVGLPVNIAENLLALEVIDKTDIYEPRAAVIEVRCFSDQDGHTAAHILIGPNEDYNPEDYEDGEEEAEDEAEAEAEAYDEDEE